jgi:hypothetical protein
MSTPTRTRLPQNQALAVRPLTAEVRSETDPNVAYTVTLPYCPCRDFHNRRGNLALGLESLLCKHLKAALGLVGTQPQTDRLDEDTAQELLISFGVRASAASAALSRAVTAGDVGVQLRGGYAVITYHNGRRLFDIRLPA